MTFRSQSHPCPHGIACHHALAAVIDKALALDLHISLLPRPPPDRPKLSTVNIPSSSSPSPASFLPVSLFNFIFFFLLLSFSLLFLFFHSTAALSRHQPLRLSPSHHIEPTSLLRPTPCRYQLRSPVPSVLSWSLQVPGVLSLTWQEGSPRPFILSFSHIEIQRVSVVLRDRATCLARVVDNSTSPDLDICSPVRLLLVTFSKQMTLDC